MGDMTTMTAPRRTHRRAWTVFWAVVALALVAACVTTVAVSGPRLLVLVVVVGLCVAGLAAALLSSFLTPDDGPAPSEPGRFVAGWSAGGFGGGGCC
jgi:hypothetical protein